MNSLLEQTRAETSRHEDVILAAAAAAQTLRRLGQILGLFRPDLPGLRAKEPGTVDQLMALIIQIRNDARKTKQFALSDAVRDGLKKIGIALEDRPDGTGWRRE